MLETVLVIILFSPSDNTSDVWTKQVHTYACEEIAEGVKRNIAVNQMYEGKVVLHECIELPQLPPA